MRKWFHICSCVRTFSVYNYCKIQNYVLECRLMKSMKIISETIISKVQKMYQLPTSFSLDINIEVPYRQLNKFMKLFSIILNFRNAILVYFGIYQRANSVNFNHKTIHTALCLSLLLDQRLLYGNSPFEFPIWAGKVRAQTVSRADIYNTF